MTGLDHHHSAAVEVAGGWLAEQVPGSVKPTIPVLRVRFGLTTMEAVEAVKLAQKQREAHYAKAS